MRSNAQTISSALGGKRAGSGYLGKCPKCGYKGALAISGTDRVLVFCHAGCTQDELIAELSARGLWDGVTVHPPKVSYDKLHYARRLWSERLPAKGSVVEKYLNSRGITAIPASIGYLQHTRHSPTGSYLPCMIAKVTRASQEITGIHRTYLCHTGKAGVEPAKMSLGPIRGGAVRLAPQAKVLAITEGIETGLSVQQATGLPTWAALSTSGMRNLIVPESTEEIVIFSDNDPPGLGASKAAADNSPQRDR